MADELENSNPPDKSRAKKENYYQVLIDARDIPHVQALHPEAVVFLRGPKANRAHYSIPGLDYASHTDILPYTSTEKMPIAHDFFDKFVVFDPLQSMYAQNKTNVDDCITGGGLMCYVVLCCVFRLFRGARFT